MSSLDLAALRAAFRADYARYEKLAALARQLVLDALRREGVACTVESRPKAEANFLRKAIKKQSSDAVKYADPLASIKDRAGARVIVAHRHEADRVCDIVRDHLDVVEFEDTRSRYKPNEIGYLGLHFLLTIRDANLDATQLDLKGLVFELQIHTKAEDAWSAVSHPILYKPVGHPASATIAARVNRAVVLIDLFDEEIMRARNEMMSEPGYRPTVMLDALQREFLSMSPRDFDPELSLGVLSVVETSYSDEELDAFAAIIEEFVRNKRGVIEQLFDFYKDDPDVHPLLFQPESIAIYERLGKVPHQLRANWIADGRFDADLLDSLRNVFGL